MAGKFIKTLKSVYDKVLTLFMLFVLVVSLVYLIVQIGAVKSEMAEYERGISRMTPKHPNIEQRDMARFDAAALRISEPFQIDIWTNRLLTVPEARVWCWDCKRPIPYDDMECPHCRAKQPVPREDDPDWSTVRDGIPDQWKRKYGIDPLSRTAAHEDLDGDGFTNLEEHLAGTDPTDPASHPPIEDRLTLERIESRPFRLRFMSKMTMPGGDFRFGLNDLITRKTHFINLGDDVLGFTVESFEHKVEEQSGTVGRKDVSVLTLASGRIKIPLIWQQEVDYQDHTIHLFFPLDNLRFVLKLRDIFEMRGNKYALISIDSATPSVVVRRTHDRKDFVVGKADAVPLAVNVETPEGSEAAEAVQDAPVMDFFTLD